MSARDRFHDCVRNALVKDGWVITHDPLRLPWGKKDLYVDLGAEQLLAAEKGERRIAVEIKSFLGKSEIDDLEKALGQFVLYRAVLAVEAAGVGPSSWPCPTMSCKTCFDEPLGPDALTDQSVQCTRIRPEDEVITRWIP